MKHDVSISVSGAGDGVSGEGGRVRGRSDTGGAWQRLMAARAAASETAFFVPSAARALFPRDAQSAARRARAPELNGTSWMLGCNSRQCRSEKHCEYQVLEALAPSVIRPRRFRRNERKNAQGRAGGDGDPDPALLLARQAFEPFFAVRLPTKFSARRLCFRRPKKPPETKKVASPALRAFDWPRQGGRGGCLSKAPGNRGRPHPTRLRRATFSRGREKERAKTAKGHCASKAAGAIAPG